jgi:hypothetical protein
MKPAMAGKSFTFRFDETRTMAASNFLQIGKCNKATVAAWKDQP